jgi:hypothetical protein
VEAYFNRGIVPAQWLARQHPSKKSLQADLHKKGSKNREFLSGELRKELLALLDQAKSDGVEIYAALYELDDPELIDALKAMGGKCNLVLGSGAYKAASKKKHTPAVPDENEVVRDDRFLTSAAAVSTRPPCRQRSGVTPEQSTGVPHRRMITKTWLGSSCGC